MSLGRYSIVAMLTIVVLRLAIGWQLFYEGVWKLKTLRSPTPWSSAGYLKNSQGPMRATFRRMTGDPDELDWLDAKKVTKRWQDWQQRFKNHYGLDKTQAAKLNYLVNGRKEIYSDPKSVTAIPDSIDLSSDDLSYPTSERISLTIKEMPEVEPKGKHLLVKADAGELRKNDIIRDHTAADLEKKIKSAETKVSISRPIRKPIVTLDEKNQRLVVDGRRRMTAEEYGRFLKLLPEKKDGKFPDDETEATFRKQLEKLYLRASRLSYVEQLRAELNGNSDWVGNEKNLQVGELQKYRDMIADYEVAAAKADQTFEHDHLKKMWSDLQTQRSSLVGPIKALESSMKDDAEELLTTKQAASGAVPAPWTSLRIADSLTIAGLTLLGLCLIAGLCTRFTAVMAAIMVFSFYLAMPPLPGLPEPPGPEHSYIVNKNLIEVLALLAIASLPTGRWFGLDAILPRFIGKKSPEAAAA